MTPVERLFAGALDVVHIGLVQRASVRFDVQADLAASNAPSLTRSLDDIIPGAECVVVIRKSA